MSKHTISFKNALRGISIALTTQTNLRIHFLIGSLVLVTAVYLSIPFAQILLLILTIALVMLAEMINTSIEFFCNAITLENNEDIKRAKDVSAGAVLISVIFATLIGLVIFIPQIINMLSTKY